MNDTGSDAPDLDEDARSIAADVSIAINKFGLYMDPNEPEHRIRCGECHEVFTGCLGWCGK